jgi:DNA-binding GntR family transcriptional regulator
VTDTRPTQLEVDAKAAELFGSGWKRLLQHHQARIDAIIARRLDQARDALRA